jgi:hypothetical protein
MEGGPLLSNWWKNSTKRFVPYLNISAQLPEKPDQEMMNRYGLRGFPSFLILDSEGTILFGKEPYWRPDSPENLESGLAEVETLFRLKKRVKENPEDRIAKAHLTLILGLMNPDQSSLKEMEAASKVEGVPADVIGRWLRERTRIRFLEVFGPYRNAFAEGAEKDELARLRKKAMERAFSMAGSGEVIDALDPDFRAFWVLAFDGAMAARDRRVGELCLKTYVDTYGPSDRFVRGMKERLAELPVQVE